jgi:hypothetical protein
MESETFKLNSREEVIQFEKLMAEYTQAKGAEPLNHISLIKAFDQLQIKKDGGKIFSALLDLQINFLLLYLDNRQAGSIWNVRFALPKIQGGSILDSPEKFFGKMDIHRFQSSYIFRYRALWDKIMGLIIMNFIPGEYGKFDSATKKKSTFEKIILEADLADKEAIRNLIGLLEKFDSKFRTPEAHGQGSLRKYSLSMQSGTGEDDPLMCLFESFNSINIFMIQIGKWFGNTIH